MHRRGRRSVGDDDRRGRGVDLVEHLRKGVDRGAAHAEEAHVGDAVGRRLRLGRDDIVRDAPGLVHVAFDQRLDRAVGLERGEHATRRLGDLREDRREFGGVDIELVGRGEEDGDDLVELEHRGGDDRREDRGRADHDVCRAGGEQALGARGARGCDDPKVRGAREGRDGARQRDGGAGVGDEHE